MIALSVLLSACGGREPPRAALRALARQTLPAEHAELLVVGGAGAGGGELASLAAECGVPYAVRSAPDGDAALRAARGEFCLLLDGAAAGAPALLAAHLRAQRERGGAVVVGPVEYRTAPSAHPFVRHVARRWSEERRAGGGPALAASLVDRGGGNVSVPRLAALDAGGLAAPACGGGCADLAWRLARRGLAVLLEPGAEAWREWAVGVAAAAAAVEARGAAAAALFARHPATLAHLPIGALGGARPPLRLLHGALLATRLPAAALAALAALARGAAPQLLHDQLYLRGARRATPTRDAWRRLTRGTAILMYHACGAPGEGASRYRVTGREFAWQMRWLRRRGYRPLSLGEYARMRAEGALPPAKSVVVTFDDGYTDNLTVAHPVLRAHGIPATIFVVTAAVGGANAWDPGGDLVGRPLLSWDELAELARCGVEVGAHTRTHRWLTAVDDAEVVDEVAGSRADVERALGRAPDAFAYPGGWHDARSEAASARAGFAAACSTIWGLNDAATDPLLLRRVDVSGEFSRLAFCWALAFGSYPPWLRAGARRRRAAAGAPVPPGRPAPRHDGVRR